MYQIYQHKDGGILLVIELQMSDPEDPMFIYDGSDTALLFRNWDSTIKLKSLSDVVRFPLRETEEILVQERLCNEVIREYAAPVRLVHDVHRLIT